METILVNTGPFWEKHPDVYPEVTRYTHHDINGHIVEAWERDKNGVMVDVTERELLYEELERAQEAMKKFEEDDNNDE